MPFRTYVSDGRRAGWSTSNPPTHVKLTDDPEAEKYASRIGREVLNYIRNRVNCRRIALIADIEPEFPPGKRRSRTPRRWMEEVLKHMANELKTGKNSRNWQDKGLLELGSPD